MATLNIQAIYYEKDKLRVTGIYSISSNNSNYTFSVVTPLDKELTLKEIESKAITEAKKGLVGSPLCH